MSYLFVCAIPSFCINLLSYFIPVKLLRKKICVWSLKFKNLKVFGSWFFSAWARNQRRTFAYWYNSKVYNKNTICSFRCKMWKPSISNPPCPALILSPGLFAVLPVKSLTKASPLNWHKKWMPPDRSVGR